ncbi:sulfite exporter TauE/SafE family protein [Aliamphritea hakodatensis]|uniref:sulfite exporter TauE/SafE family protein n=1 Tax=Aliamphritea hakodatensis TaxID=2895352 RepID=UPI0022FD7C9C|nr:sulfite exporter TauE/SafE family protein [Aliamphritea hakodatensis]
MTFTLIDLLALTIAIVGSTLQGMVGIGFGLLAAPLLFLIDPAYVPVPVIFGGFMLSLLVVSSQRHELHWRRVMPAILARIPGSYIGVLLLLAMPSHILAIVFGSSLLIAVYVSCRRFNITATPVNLGIGGFISGIVGTATSVGGPPIALVYQNETRITARNELAAFFLIGSPLSLVLLFLEGTVTDEHIMLSVKLLPGMFIGWLLSRYLGGKLKQQSARPALLIISAVSAVMVLSKGLMAL